MTHEIRFWYDERFIARPWGIVCICGKHGCFPSQAEAEQAIEHHKKSAEIAPGPLGGQAAANTVHIPVGTRQKEEANDSKASKKRQSQTAEIDCSRAGDHKSTV